MDSKLALKVNKFIHEQCVDGVPHDIGWNVVKLFYQHVVSGSCFWGHKWTKWQQYEREMVNIRTGVEFIELFQKKHCVICNKMVVETVR